jgi:hypothetical protein
VLWWLVVSGKGRGTPGRVADFPSCDDLYQAFYHIFRVRRPLIAAETNQTAKMAPKAKKRPALKNAISKQSKRPLVMSLQDRIACIDMTDLKNLPDIVPAAEKDEY